MTLVIGQRGTKDVSYIDTNDLDERPVFYDGIFLGGPVVIVFSLEST